MRFPLFIRLKAANTPTGYADEFAYFRLNLNTTEHTHVWDTDFTVDQTPTCTEGGRKSIHCQICNETKDEIAIPATGHSFVYHERIDATKEAQGTKAHYTCKNCAMVFDAMKMKQLLIVSSYRNLQRRTQISPAMELARPPMGQRAFPRLEIRVA